MYAGDCDRLLEIAMGGWKMVRWLEIARDGFGSYGWLYIAMDGLRLL